MCKKYFLITFLFIYIILYTIINLNTVYSANIERPIPSDTDYWSSQYRVTSVNTEYTIDYIKDTLIPKILVFIFGITTSIAIMILILNIVKRFLSTSDTDITKVNKVIIGIIVGLMFILLSYTIIEIITKFWPR